MRIKSIEIIGGTLRDNYVIGCPVNGQKLTEIRLEERFVMGLASPQYIGFSEEGRILFTVSASCPCVVEYVYD